MLKLGKKTAQTSELDLSGERIAQHFPVKKMQDFVERLKIDPHDSEARIGLTESFAMKGIKGNLIVYRDVLLHAMLEVDGGKISTTAVNIAVVA